MVSSDQDVSGSIYYLKINQECHLFIFPGDYKDLDGSYLSEFASIYDRTLKANFFNYSTAARSRVMLETASVAGGAVAAMLLAGIVGFFVYLKSQNKKCEFEVESQKLNHSHDIIKLHRCDSCQISDQFTILIKYHNG